VQTESRYANEGYTKGLYWLIHEDNRTVKQKTKNIRQNVGMLPLADSLLWYGSFTRTVFQVNYCDTVTYVTDNRIYDITRDIR